MYTETAVYKQGPTLVTKEELIGLWRLTTPTELRVFNRMLNPNLSKRVCPKYIDPKHIIEIGGVYKFKFDLERGWPAIKVKGSQKP